MKHSPTGFQKLNARRHARAVTERVTLIRAFVAQHPGVTRQSILDAMPGKRSNSGEALKRLLARGAIRNIGGSSKRTAAFVLGSSSNKRERRRMHRVSKPDQIKTLTGG
jgi:hypothetical protein